MEVVDRDAAARDVGLADLAAPAHEVAKARPDRMPLHLLGERAPVGQEAPVHRAHEVEGLQPAAVEAADRHEQPIGDREARGDLPDAGVLVARGLDPDGEDEDEQRPADEGFAPSGHPVVMRALRGPRRGSPRG